MSHLINLLDGGRRIGHRRGGCFKADPQEKERGDGRGPRIGQTGSLPKLVVPKDMNARRRPFASGIGRAQWYRFHFPLFGASRRCWF